MDTTVPRSTSHQCQGPNARCLLFGMIHASPVAMRRRLALRAVLVLVAVMTLASAACATSINRVLADPSRYRDREVRVSGRVADSYSIVGRGAYRLEDRSGQLWVVSDRGVPRKGANVTVKGRIREGFNLGALGDLIRLPGGAVVMIESEHRVR